MGSLLRVAALTELQYRANLLQSLIGAIAYQGAQLLFIGVLLYAFGAIGGWSAPEVLLLVGIRMASHAVYAFGFRQVIGADQLVHTGEYDRFLLRPVHPFVQLLTYRFNLQQFGDVVLASAIMIFAISINDVAWTPWLALWCAAAILGGGFVEAAMQTARAALAFRLRNTNALVYMVDTVTSTYANFPLHIFGPAGMVFFTLGVPLAFVAWIPAALILGRGEELWFPAPIGWATPALGLILLASAIAFFNTQSRQYSSPGH